MGSTQSHDEGQLGHFKYSKRVVLKTILGRPADEIVGLIGQRVVIGGWVRWSHEFKKEPEVQASDAMGPTYVRCLEILRSKIPFLRSITKDFGGDHHQKLVTIVMPKLPPQPPISILQISDGSCVASLWVRVDSAVAHPSHVLPMGTCILAEGILQNPSVLDKGIIELKAEKILHIGRSDQNRYPLSGKGLPLENLRDYAHFAPRTRTVASVMRIRNALTHAIHTFFQENGFLHVHVPIITTTNSNCENIFQVTTLLDHHKETTDDRIEAGDNFDNVQLEHFKSSIEEKSKKVDELKRSDSNEEAQAAAIEDLNKTNEIVSQLEATQKRKTGKSSIETNKLDFSKDLFSCKTYLTASDRMHLESYASALGNVYSFGPRFHANRSDSKKFLPEMWMAELEIAFSELQDLMNCAIDFLKFICKWILDNCIDDLEFVSKRAHKLLVVKDRLKLIQTGNFTKISYMEAVKVLMQVKGKEFETKVERGVALNEEHESYLTDEIYKTPLIIYNHAKELKPFNVRLNEDGRTAASFDIIVPNVGTLISGSQSEERCNMLSTRIRKLGLEEEKQYKWYLDLRKYGNVKCCGFSFMFDPFVLYATGLDDVRDAVPFPRSLGKANN